jgi:hypothetical protein
MEAPVDVVVPAPSLTRYDAPGRPRGVILMLHGGKERSELVVDGRSASWRRSAAMQRAIAGRAREAGASTWLLRYRHRGWNGGTGPVAAARWALDQVRRDVGEVPVVLVAALAGRHLVAAHGHRDKITSYRATQAYVDRARGVAASAELRDMGPVGHYMLRRIPAWNHVAVDSALALLGD